MMKKKMSKVLTRGVYFCYKLNMKNDKINFNNKGKNIWQ